MGSLQPRGALCHAKKAPPGKTEREVAKAPVQEVVVLPVLGLQRRDHQPGGAHSQGDVEHRRGAAQKVASGENHEDATLNGPHFAGPPYSNQDGHGQTPSSTVAALVPEVLYIRSKTNPQRHQQQWLDRRKVHRATRQHPGSNDYAGGAARHADVVLHNEIEWPETIEDFASDDPRQGAQCQRETTNQGRHGGVGTPGNPRASTCSGHGPIALDQGPVSLPANVVELVLLRPVPLVLNVDHVGIAKEPNQGVEKNGRHPPSTWRATDSGQDGH
mmetsp:Transcript_49360/g.114434  ORF Transcript_49360/g.114434 Transcript_49360/m.114434 type:complete len:273 (+) Transcript_49360:129-947(+)